MMLPQVFISAFILLPAASGSFPEVYGMGGDPVTLPCFYPESRVLSFVCWGRGECASDTCGQTLVWTDGNRVHYRTSGRYQINAQLLQGNASLTIEDAYESDSGLFCCRVEMKGWDGVQTLTTSLQVRPGSNSTRKKGLAIGLSIFLLLLVLVSTLVITNYILMKKRPGSPSLVSLCVSKTRTLLNKEVA
ncbi:hepatitis A virus cellular receptor 1 homolog [Arvicanthis niloticus]|uniref:hepatitis A virus cellular receptor 1 homolog n=1 Tax=Arvicanthis niloticus TaxID=61156 RepID=UPI001486E5C1|nr:hepatitis A virus cellular receptor 1 homolog [Arvicanthis niloticus]